MDHKTICHYRIIRELGEGGMGKVYLAEDTHLDRRAALKVLSPEFAADPLRVARFEREAKAIAALNHPNIVTIYSVEQTEDLRFLTMEVVDGDTLDGVIPLDGLPLDRFLGIAEPLTDALSAAHRKGITHRDLKPRNIMISGEGRVKILDFGLAKLLEGQSTTADQTHSTLSLTTGGMILGTIPYMSPEQVKGTATDQRSDIFSLGIVLYEMLTGRRPFTGETAAELVSSILRDEPPAVIELNPRVPQQLERVLRRCLEKDPDHRYQDANEVCGALRSLQREWMLEQAAIGGDSSGAAARAAPLRWIPEPGERSFPSLLTSRVGLALLVALVFVINYAETAAETVLRETHGVGVRLGNQLAVAVHWLEGSYSLEGHEATNALAVYGCSISYFFIFPLLGIATALAFARRRTIRPFRVFSLAILADYAISLPFFLFFPVPERWAYPASGAMLLSDRWSSTLIETIRPISGLDNCFPSFHVSLTTIIIMVCFLYRHRFRTCILALGLTVVLSTFVLGIHWAADILAGTAVGVASVGIARRIDGAISPENG